MDSGSNWRQYRDAAQSYFDAAYYLDANPDVRESGQDALGHFLDCGWLEGRNPSRMFDVNYYLAANPDVSATGVNPLLHYVWAGKREGRRPARPLDAARRKLENSVAPSDQVSHWAVAEDRSDALTAEALKAVLSGGSARTGLILSVSHDDYAVNYGGVQNLIDDEQRAFAKAGWEYLHISPAAPLPILADARPAEEFRVKLRLNREPVGVGICQELIESIAELSGRGEPLAMVIHQLLGHSPELMTGLVEAAGVPPIVWVHDFFTLCPSYALMRNNVKFCGAPPVDSASCAVCTFGADRSAQLPRMQAFFDATNPTVLAPSASALDLWLRRGGLSHSGAEVVPLARLVMAGDPDSLVKPNGRKLRVAYIGARTLFKGWFVFEDLALGLADDPRYAFYQLGVANEEPLPGCIRNVPVRVLPGQRDAMIEAIAEHRIDVVISRALWPETFCFAVHEALAAGAFVISCSDAGNVWPAVQANAPDQGCIADSEAQLRDMFVSGEILQRFANAKRARGALLTGGGTADWLLGGRPMHTRDLVDDATVSEIA